LVRTWPGPVLGQSTDKGDKGDHHPLAGHSTSPETGINVTQPEVDVHTTSGINTQKNMSPGHSLDEDMDDSDVTISSNQSDDDHRNDYGTNEMHQHDCQ
jgi:hypothetical protein